MIKVTKTIRQKKHIALFVHESTKLKDVESNLGSDLALLFQAYKKAKKFVKISH